jgi:hypothetical protein
MLSKRVRSGMCSRGIATPLGGATYTADSAYIGARLKGARTCHLRCSKPSYLLLNQIGADEQDLRDHEA